MIGRIVWVAGLILLAAATSYAQLDRQSRFSPELARGVPEPFRAFAQSHIAEAAIAGDDPDLALAETVRLIERRPLPAEHLRLLAAAQIKAEQYDKAGVTIQIAARRGWRDGQAQEAMLRIALAAGDRTEATLRYAALLNSPRTDNDLLIELGPRVFGANGVTKADREGRQALVTLLAGETRWRRKFLVRGAQVMPANAFAQVVRDSAERGARFDCEALRAAVSTLDRREAGAGLQLEHADFLTNTCT